MVLNLTKTSRSKSWYTPRVIDKRPSGARTRSYRGHYNSEKGKKTKRTIYPGYSGLSSLGRGIYEEKDTNYKEQENKVFQINNEVKSLITELESKEKND